MTKNRNKMKPIQYTETQIKQMQDPANYYINNISISEMRLPIINKMICRLINHFLSFEFGICTNNETDYFDDKNDALGSLKLVCYKLLVPDDFFDLFTRGRVSIDTNDQYEDDELLEICFIPS